jgi:hypothetical protein
MPKKFWLAFPNFSQGAGGLAFGGIIPHISRFIRIKAAIFKGIGRTNIHTFPAIAAFGLRYGITCRFQRCISQNRNPAGPWPIIFGNQQATFSNPTQTRKMGSKFMREQRANPGIRKPLRCCNRIRRISPLSAKGSEIPRPRGSAFH